MSAETEQPSAPGMGGKVVVDEYLEFAASKQLPDWMSTYRGLPIHSMPVLHERIAQLVSELVPRGSRVLDLAAGAGALTLRIRDQGFEVVACDYVSENFRLHDSVPFHRLNLNLGFAERFEGAFDAVVACEILEHIENPRHVLREIARTLRPSGKLIITTPNVESSFALATRMTTGAFSLFDDAYYRRDGHITPITSCTLKRSLDEAGFELQHFSCMGPFEPAPRLAVRALMQLLDACRCDPEMSRGSAIVATAELRARVS